MFMIYIFGFEFDLHKRTMHQPALNPWHLDHDRTFHVLEKLYLPTEPSEIWYCSPKIVDIKTPQYSNIQEKFGKISYLIVVATTKAYERQGHRLVRFLKTMSICPQKGANRGDSGQFWPLRLVWFSSGYGNDLYTKRKVKKKYIVGDIFSRQLQQALQNKTKANGAHQEF